MSSTPYVPPSPEFLSQHVTVKDLIYRHGVSESKARRILNGEQDMPAELAAQLANDDPNGPLGKPLAEGSLLPEFEAFPRYQPTDDELDQDGDGDVDEDDAMIASHKVVGQAMGNAERFHDRMADGILDEVEHLETIRDSGELSKRQSVFGAICHVIKRKGRVKLSGLRFPNGRMGEAS